MDDQSGFGPGKDGPKDPTEGVRIIGAEEAAEAMERGDVAARRGEDQPRFGDRPSPPPAGPRPALRFPLGASSDLENIERPAVLPSDPAPSRPVTGPVNMPHWTEPATGEVPRVIIGEENADEDLDAWSSFATSAPRWRDDDADWEDAGFDDPSLLGDDSPMGALDDDRPTHDELFSFDDVETLRPAADESAAEVDDFVVDETPEARRARRAWRESDHPDDVSFANVGAGIDDAGLELGGYEDPYSVAAEPAVPTRRRISSSNLANDDDVSDPYAAPLVPSGGGRNMTQAVGTGLVLAGVLAVTMAIGPFAVVLLVAAILVLCAGDYFRAVRSVGYEPLVALGLAAVALFPLATWWKHEMAIPLIVVIVLIAALTTFVVGAGGEGRVIDSVGVTLLGVVWIGVFGSFAGLMLGYSSGRGMVFAAILGTVANDVGAYFVGKSMGTKPLSDVSPNKTVEGVVGGGLATILAVTFLCGIFPKIAPFNSVGHAFLLGLAIALAAPLGDLCQSVVKRDLGVKDMGDLLPGHGGVFDRFDAMLFVLPTTYFVLWFLQILPVR